MLTAVGAAWIAAMSAQIAAGLRGVATGPEVVAGDGVVAGAGVVPVQPAAIRASASAPAIRVFFNIGLFP